MSSVNKVIIVGNLGKDPETRYTPGGDALTNITVATTESWKDKATGERREATEWHRIVFFGRSAEIAGQYLKKGSQVYIEGRLQTRKWQDKEGQDRYTTEIRADEMKMLGRREGGGGDERQGAARGDSSPAPAAQRGSAPAPRREPPKASGSADPGPHWDDDIPFVGSAISVDPILKGMRGVFDF